MGLKAIANKGLEQNSGIGELVSRETFEKVYRKEIIDKSLFPKYYEGILKGYLDNYKPLRMEKVYQIIKEDQNLLNDSDLF